MALLSPAFLASASFLSHAEVSPALHALCASLQCKAAATTGSTCRTASGDKECSRCDSAGWCYQCNANKYFDSAYNVSSERRTAFCTEQ